MESSSSVSPVGDWQLLVFGCSSCITDFDSEPVSVPLLLLFFLRLLNFLHDRQIPHRFLTDGTFVWHLVHAQLSTLLSSLNKLDLGVSSKLLGGFADFLPIRAPGFHDEQFPHRFLVDGIFVWQLVHVQSPALSALIEEDADLEVSFNFSGISFADLITALSDDLLTHSLLLPLPRFAAAGALLLLLS